jgi:hypothetical protein
VPTFEALLERWDGESGEDRDSSTAAAAGEPADESRSAPL